MDKPKSPPVGYMFDCVIDNIKPDINGHGYIVLKTHAKINEDVFAMIGTPLTCALKKQKTKRTVTANSYCWELCKQIAETAGLSSVDVYKKAVREYGVYEDAVVDNDKVSKVCESWSNIGIGWFTEKVDYSGSDKVIIRFYFGTSSYSTSQMSRIIDFLVGEAEDLGITILSERKRKEILKEWEENKTKEKTDEPNT